MNIKVYRIFLTAALSLLLTAPLWGYAYSGATSNSIAAWLPGTIPMQIKLGTGVLPLQDSTNYSTSVQAAMTSCSFGSRACMAGSSSLNRSR